MSESDAIDILLVEDDPNDVELTRRALTKAKLANAIAIVSDGAEALDFLFRTGAYADRPAPNPMVVLLDLHLPKIDGLEVLRRIKSDERTRTIPVVVLTSRAQRVEPLRS